MSPISSPVIPASGGMRSSTGMDANGNGNDILGHEQFRSPSRDPSSGSVSVSHLKLGSGSGSRVIRKDCDYEPGGRLRCLERGLWDSEGCLGVGLGRRGPVEGEWYRRQN